MEEIESRILDIDVKKVIQQLETLGAKKIFDGIQTNHIFKKKGFKGFFRIREEKGKILVTLKTKKENTQHAKIRDERERTTLSVNQARRDIEQLGFSFHKKYDKPRIEYVIDDTHFCIDTYPGLPTFLEIEAPSEKKIFLWAEKLGFAKEQLNNWGTKKLQQHYGIQQ